MLFFRLERGFDRTLWPWKAWREHRYASLSLSHSQFLCLSGLFIFVVILITQFAFSGSGTHPFS
ncbi:hypothetical protein SAMN05192539_11062 [Paraburkholderia diazotrophica]|uniref:Uncharacterized protein n=1 Tax=Paraburkholderia diazotrophica TaxID=667676 RepID=A0A1H7EKP3_9BURK|nr:hypothetical protein SAMN05192539_11062 [Paraburkholderia diazotrophica]